MKDRILKELNHVLDENTVGFFSFTVSQTKDGLIPTITWICDKGLPEQREEITTALLNLFHTVESIFEDTNNA